MEDFYIIVITLIFSAFFSGMEIAFVSADKLQLEVHAKTGGFADKILVRFLSNQSGFLGTTLIGNNIALVVYGIFMARAIDPWLDNVLPPILNQSVGHLVIQTLISTLLVLVTAEFLPKSLFILDPNRILRWMALPMLIVYYLLWVVTTVVTWFSKLLIIYVFRLKYVESKPVYGLADLNAYIMNLVKQPNPDALDDEVHDVDEHIFANALEFKNLKVRDCMIPRTEITAIDVEDGIEELKETLIKSGYSKVLIYEDSIDNVIGYCHAHELFKKPTEIKKIMTPIFIVPETMRAQELMVKFIAERRGLALVVDEYGGTSGLISLEDLIEEIVGEIQDEHDMEALREEKIGKHMYILSARLEIEYLNDKYGWDLPEGEYDTIGGLILSITGDIPEEGQVIEIDNFRMEVMEMEDRRIVSIKLAVG